MFELIKKDIFLCRKNLLTMSVVIILFFLASELFMKDYAGKYDFVFFILWFFLNYSFIDNMFIHDEKNCSIKYILVLPVSRSTVVYSKYAVIFFVTLACSALSMLSVCADNIIRNGTVLNSITEGKTKTILSFIILTFLIVSVYLPLFYKFGYERASSICLVSFLTLFAVLMATGFVFYLKDLTSMDRFLKSLMDVITIKVLLPLSIILYCVSAGLSQILFKGKSY